MEISEYIKQVNKLYRTGQAREHSYRPMLQQLLAKMLPDFVVINEPARIECGAPDYIITRKDIPVFYIEAKDINDNDLDGNNQHREQFRRYKESLDHIIFTDYLDFHLYENRQWVKNVRLAEIQGENIRLVKGNEDDFKALISHVADAHPAAITSATKLAQQMAAKARTLASVINRAFTLAEKDDSARQRNQDMQSQLEAFRRVLIHDLTPEGFADIYAQTIAYGLFAARLHDETPDTFSRQEAASLIPRSNPFLRQIFQSIAGYDLDGRIAWVVDDLVNVFLATDIKKVMGTYSRNGLHHDPMIHFYEDFLSAYNPELRKSKGVWYTPQPIVQFIVRAVDEILQRDFGLANGLADNSMIEHEVVNEAYTPGERINGRERPKTITKQMHRVQILDPATGTGTFLAEVVNQIHDKFDGMQGMWQGYVTDHLIPRLHGFELLMASYAVAHLKLDMLLSETGFVQPADQERLKIYLTNSLEEHQSDMSSLWSSWLSNEAREANHIKRDCPVMVMIGNPPYSGISQNNGEWITRLINDYKIEPNSNNRLRERKTWLNDDYVKFIRLAQDYLTRSGEGVLAFINNNGFIDNPTFRGMRWSLLTNFDEIYILNLHGNPAQKEVAPDGSKDENVFGITIGVSINILIKTGKKAQSDIAQVYYKDVYGSRFFKFKFLSNNRFEEIPFTKVNPFAPQYSFCPMQMDLKDIYERGIKISELFPTQVTGLVSARDGLVIDFEQKCLYNKIVVFCDQNRSDDEIRQLFFGKKKGTKYLPGDSRGWSLSYAREKIRSNNHQEIIRPILYRPFDKQYIYYSRDMVDWGRETIFKHVLRPNITLIVSRQAVTDNWSHVLVSPFISDNRTFYSNKGITQVCPLYLYISEFGEEKKVPNLNPDEWKKFNDAVGRDTTPEELLAYIYAVLHSPSYRERYKEFLKVDFPRIPLPESVEDFESLVGLGQQLIDLHLMSNAQTWKLETTFPEAGTSVINRYNLEDDKVWINETQYFGNVPESAWNFYIGGYQPAQKWLKDRKGHTLNFDEINHYRRIIHALRETERLMNEIG